jgi:hypothetical protein
VTLGSAAWGAVLAALPASGPSPSPRPADPESVSPGLWGFLVVFVLAIVVWLLMRNMTARLRRLRFREQERLRREAAEPGAAPPGQPGSPGSIAPDDDPPAPGVHR